MSGSVVDFDEVAADDALIESMRAGATLDELPNDDAAVGVLVSLRDGVDAPSREIAPAIAEAGHAVVAGVVSYRRSIAASVVTGVLVTAGVGTAVAGDPTAAFTYIFRQGVEAGSRVGTPGGDVNTDSVGGIDQRSPALGVSTVPVRQGSSAASSSDDGSRRESMGFESQRRFWTVPTPRGLESISDGRSESARDADSLDGGVHGHGDSQVIDRATRKPEESENPGPEETTPPPEDNGVQTEPDETTDAPDEETTLTTPPPDESTSPPPEETTSPPEETTSPPPEDETSAPPPETTTPPPSEDSSSPTDPSPSESPSQSESPSSPAPTESASPN